ncbi:MAG: aminotransferase class IV [Chitinophagia bacterium]|jgi:4-amino-4-deoxychorismate lyase
MYLFFETIRYQNGILENVPYHQARMNRTLKVFEKNTSIFINEIPLEFDFKMDEVYKIRILYNVEGNYKVEYELYKLKKINTVAISLINQEEYSFKYTNRHWLNEALEKAGTDEIIIVKDEIIKDGNYANLVFYNGTEWHTPKNPLLLGTHRARLIDENKIIQKEIKIMDLANYEKVKFINAMMLWDESPEIAINNVEINK